MSGNKVLKIIADSHPPDARVQKEVNSLVRHGYQVDIICWDRDDNEKLPAKVENEHGTIFRYKKSSKRGKAFAFILNNISFYFFILFKAKKLEFDFIHVHSVQVFPVGLILKLFFSKPLIYDVHELTETFGLNIHKNFGKIVLAIEKRLVKYVDVLLTVSEGLEQRYRPLLKEEAINEILINCLPLHDNVYKLFKKSNEKYFVIGRVGNIREKSRLDIISKAIVLLNHRGYKVKFRYAGMVVGDYKKQFEEAENRMGEFSEYKSWISLDKFENFYSDIDLVLNIHEPSDEIEEKNAYFSKVFEAISFGVPCVINSFSSMNRIIQEHNIGLIIEKKDAQAFADGIEKLINNKAELKQMSINCTELAKKEINWNIMEERLIRCYTLLDARV